MKFTEKWMGLEKKVDDTEWDIPDPERQLPQVVSHV